MYLELVYCNCCSNRAFPLGTPVLGKEPPRTAVSMVLFKFWTGTDVPWSSWYDAFCHETSTASKQKQDSAYGDCYQEWQLCQRWERRQGLVDVQCGAGSAFGSYSLTCMPSHSLHLLFCPVPWWVCWLSYNISCTLKHGNCGNNWNWGFQFWKTCVNQLQMHSVQCLSEE